MGRLSTDLFSLVETLSASSAPTIFQKKKETFASVLMTVLLLLSPSDVVRSENTLRPLRLTMCGVNLPQSPGLGYLAFRVRYAAY